MFLRTVKLASLSLIIFLRALFLSRNKGITLLSWRYSPGVNSTQKSYLLWWGKHRSFNFLKTLKYLWYLVGTCFLTYLLNSFIYFLAASFAEMGHYIFYALIPVTNLFRRETGFPADLETDEAVVLGSNGGNASAFKIHTPVSILLAYLIDFNSGLTKDVFRLDKTPSSIKILGIPCCDSGGEITKTRSMLWCPVTSFGGGWCRESVVLGSWIKES